MIVLFNRIINLEIFSCPEEFQVNFQERLIFLYRTYLYSRNFDTHSHKVFKWTHYLSI